MPRDLKIALPLQIQALKNNDRWCEEIILEVPKDNNQVNSIFKELDKAIRQSEYCTGLTLLFPDGGGKEFNEVKSKELSNLWSKITHLSILRKGEIGMLTKSYAEKVTVFCLKFIDKGRIDSLNLSGFGSQLVLNQTICDVIVKKSIKSLILPNHQDYFLPVISILNQNKGLEELRFSDFPKNNDLVLNFSAALHKSSLQRAYLACRSFHLSGFFSRVSHLQQLRVEIDSFDNEKQLFDSIMPLASNNKLKKLHLFTSLSNITYDVQSDQGMPDNITKNQILEDLSLETFRQTRLPLQIFSFLANLRYLSIKNIKLDQASKDFIAEKIRVGSLIELRLDQLTYEDDLREIFAELKNNRSLRLLQITFSGKFFDSDMEKLMINFHSFFDVLTTSSIETLSISHDMFNLLQKINPQGYQNFLTNKTFRQIIESEEKSNSSLPEDCTKMLARNQVLSMAFEELKKQILKIAEENYSDDFYQQLMNKAEYFKQMDYPRYQELLTTIHEPYIVHYSNFALKDKKAFIYAIHYFTAFNQQVTPAIVNSLIPVLMTGEIDELELKEKSLFVLLLCIPNNWNREERIKILAAAYHQNQGMKIDNSTSISWEEITGRKEVISWKQLLEIVKTIIKDFNTEALKDYSRENLAKLLQVLQEKQLLPQIIEKMKNCFLLEDFVCCPKGYPLEPIASPLNNNEEVLAAAKKIFAAADKQHDTLSSLYEKMNKRFAEIDAEMILKENIEQFTTTLQKISNPSIAVLARLKESSNLISSLLKEGKQNQQSPDVASKQQFRPSSPSSTAAFWVSQEGMGKGDEQNLPKRQKIQEIQENKKGTLPPQQEMETERVGKGF